MGKQMKRLKEIISLLMVFLIILTGMPWGVMKVEATGDADSKKEYNILVWSPAPVPDLRQQFDSLCKIYEELSTEEMTIHLVKQYTGTENAPNHFKGTEVLAQEYDLIFILMSMVELNENDIEVFRQYLKAGGRIVMHGEWNGNSSSVKTDNRIGNENLTKAAQALGTNFTITDKNWMKPLVADINTDANLIGGTALAEPGTITFDAFAEIDFAKPAEVIASYEGAAGIVDQAVEKGRITVFSDCNFYYTHRNDAVNDLFIRILTNSVENMDITEDGGDPNESFGIVHEWNYSVSDNVITATCSYEDCEYKTTGVTLTLNAETPFVYSGVSYNGVSVENNITPVTKEAAGEVSYYNADVSGNTIGEPLSLPPINAGTYIATIPLAGETAKAVFEIVPKELTEIMVDVSPISLSHNNLEQGPIITVTDGAFSLNPGVDYEVSGDIRATDVDEYEVTIEGKGNYTGSVLKTWNIVDESAPIGSIEVAENKWTKFLDSITFELFFKETQSVTITAKDEGSGVDKVIYHLSDTELTKDEVEALSGDEWIEMEMVNGSGTFDIYPDDKYIVYAKITNKVGNVTYLSSDGIVLDAKAPIISGIEEEKIYCESITFTVSDNYLDSVNVDGKIVDADESEQYVITADDKEHTVLATDKAGNSTTVVITVNNGHTASDVVEENRKEATCITEGSYEEVVTCIICEEELSRTDKVIEMTGHKYGEPVFAWSDDYSSAKATFTCEKDETHVEIIDAIVTSEVTKEATQVEKGQITYTATVEKEGMAYTDQKVKETEMLQPEPKPEPEPELKPEPEPSQDVEVPPEEVEKVELILNEKLKVDQTGKKIKITWGKITERNAAWTNVTGADGYDVYVQYCGKKYKKKPTKTVGANVNAITVTRLNGKKLDLKKNYKIYVEAFKYVDGQKVKLGKTVYAHIVGKNNATYTNAKKVKVKKSKYTLTVGKTAKIKASTVLVDKNKKQLTNAHTTEFRYATSDKNVATVSKKGKIKAVGKGKCTIYVYARNGHAKKVTVTVK